MTHAATWEAADAHPTTLGLDARVAAAVLARWVAFDAESQPDPSALRTALDQQLVELTRAFSKPRKDASDALELHDAFAAFPEVLYHLRRSPLLDVFNSAPDETVYFRHLFFRCFPLLACLAPASAAMMWRCRSRWSA